MRSSVAVAAIALALGTAANAAPTATAAAVVDAFHSALAHGDTKGAAALLADDVLIFEGGEAERSKAEYAAHHLGADAAFARVVKSVTTRRSGVSAGDVAWVTTEGRTTGTYKGKAIDHRTTETMVLRRTGGGWRIAHVHWSSAPAH